MLLGVAGLWVCQGTGRQGRSWAKGWLVIQEVRADKERQKQAGKSSRVTRAGTGQREAGLGSLVRQ